MRLVLTRNVCASSLERPARRKRMKKAVLSKSLVSAMQKRMPCRLPVKAAWTIPGPPESDPERKLARASPHSVEIPTERREASALSGESGLSSDADKDGALADKPSLEGAVVVFEGFGCIAHERILFGSCGLEAPRAAKPQLYHFPWF